LPAPAVQLLITQSIAIDDQDRSQYNPVYGHAIVRQAGPMPPQAESDDYFDRYTRTRFHPYAHARSLPLDTQQRAVEHRLQRAIEQERASATVNAQNTQQTNTVPADALPREMLQFSFHALQPLFAQPRNNETEASQSSRHAWRQTIFQQRRNMESNDRNTSDSVQRDLEQETRENNDHPNHWPQDYQKNERQLNRSLD